MITVTIPTELVDAVVEQPQLSNIKIENFPDNVGEIAIEKDVTLTLKQYADVVSDGIVEIDLVSPQTAFVAFQPDWFGTGALAPNETKNYNIRIINLGSPDKTEFTAQITVKNTAGVVTDTKTFTGVLLPRQGNFSILTVHVRDAETEQPVNGIQVVATYEGQSKTAYTSEGSVTFDFYGATPTVTVTVPETPEYQEAVATVQMHEGYNEVTIDLYRKGVEPSADWSWILWLILIATVIFAFIFIIKRKRRKEK